MATDSGKGPLNTLYGVALNEAIASGDVAKMSAARDAAFSHIAMSSEVSRLLPELENAIKSKGAPIRPLYAVTIQDAMARGDQAELTRLKGEVAYYSDLLKSGGAMASEEVVDDRHGVALVEQPQRRVGADESTTAGDEDLHGALSGASRCEPRENRGNCVRNPIVWGIAGAAVGLLPAASDRSDAQVPRGLSEAPSAPADGSRFDHPMAFHEPRDPASVQVPAPLPRVGRISGLWLQPLASQADTQF